MKKKFKGVSFEVIVCIFILIIAGGLVFQEELNDLDELWQYNFARNILSGLVPYRDFNIISTPFFPFLAAIFLKIFTNQLIIMRIYNTLIFFGILYMAYKIFKLLGINKCTSILSTIIMYFLFYYDLGVEYNYLILLITMLSLYIELYRLKKNSIFDCKNEIILGILIGLTIVTKHTIGVLLTGMFCLYKIIFITNKEEFNKVLKIILFRLVGAIIPLILFLSYLIINNSFNDFVNYAILGIGKFKNNVPYLYLLNNKNILIMAFAFVVPIFFLSFIYYIRFKNKKQKELILLIYAITMFCGMFPIANSGHFIIYAFLGIIYSIYTIYVFCRNIINNIKVKIFIKEFIKIFILLFIIVYPIKSVSNVMKIYKESYKNNNIKYFNWIIIGNKTEQEIKNIDEYIMNNTKKIYILDSAAAIYMIPIDIYNKDYDMFNKGNFGRNGEERLITEISESQNTQYLILKDVYKQNWQAPLNIINYIKVNKEKVGEIEIFDIYE